MGFITKQYLITQLQNFYTKIFGDADVKYLTEHQDISSLEAMAHKNGQYLPSVNLGTSYTSELKEDISSGAFKKAVVGGYLTINGHVYDFVHPDYWLNTGDTACTTHHMVVVPRSNLVSGQMNSSNDTTGAYIGSAMKASGGELDEIKAIIQADFGSANILTHREYFSNAVTNGYESAGAWYDSDIDLMNEEMVYGGVIFGNILNGTNIPNSYTIDKSQLELFARRPDLITTRAYWWLRDVVSSAYFASVSYYGLADANHASASLGVRPAFAIC